MANEPMTTEEAKQHLDSARSDIEAILASLGALAMLSSACGHVAEVYFGLHVSGEPSEMLADITSAELPNVAGILDHSRRKLSEIIEELGDWHNAKDGVSATMEAITAPVFDMNHKRDNGETLDD